MTFKRIDTSTNLNCKIATIIITGKTYRAHEKASAQVTWTTTRCALCEGGDIGSGNGIRCTIYKHIHIFTDTQSTTIYPPGMN